MTEANNIIETGNLAFFNFVAAAFLWHNSQTLPLFPQKAVSEKNQIALVSPNNLLLDERNPRLVGLLSVDKTGGKISQEELLRVIWENMAINELAASIASDGFYGHEPLLAEPLNGGKYVVIEGNRRLATVRLLLDESLRQKLKATDLPLPKGKQLKSLDRLPVWKVSRGDAWQAIGFKHVHGPRRWTSYAKAEIYRRLAGRAQTQLERNRQKNRGQL